MIFILNKELLIFVQTFIYFSVKKISSQAATIEMKQTNYGMKKLNLKKRINKRPKLVQKSIKKFVIQKKSVSCLNENETLRAFKAKEVLEMKKKYGNLFVKGCYFRNDEHLKADLYERKVKFNELDP